MPSKPHDDDLLLMAQLQDELERSQLTTEERRGKEVLLRNMNAKFNVDDVLTRAAHIHLARQFDPDYKMPKRVEDELSSEERARRDEYRKHQQAWKRLQG